MPGSRLILNVVSFTTPAARLVVLVIIMLSCIVQGSASASHSGDKFFPFGIHAGDTRKHMAVRPPNCFRIAPSQPVYTSCTHDQRNKVIRVCPNDNLIRGKDFNAHILGHALDGPHVRGTFFYRHTPSSRQVELAVSRYAHDRDFSASWTLFATWANISGSDLFHPPNSKNTYQMVMSADFKRNQTYFFFIYGDNVKVDSSVSGVAFNAMTQTFLLPEMQRAGFTNQTIRTSNVDVPGYFLFRLGSQGSNNTFAPLPVIAGAFVDNRHGINSGVLAATVVGGFILAVMVMFAVAYCAWWNEESRSAPTPEPIEPCANQAPIHRVKYLYYYPE